MPEKKTLFIIDDSPSNIKVLNEILKEDYIIKAATSGKEAFDYLESCEPINNTTAFKSHNLSADLTKSSVMTMPEIILLDIVMPEMNGYEVCRKLKNHRKTADIPIIFVTAQDDIENEEMGFNTGALDYITKPVNPVIVKARVKNQLLIKEQKDMLKNSISILQHKAELLYHKAELGMLAAGLAHDINNILFAAMMIDNLPYMLPDNIKEKEIIKEYVKNTMESLSMGREICIGFTNYLKDIGEEEMIHTFLPLLKPLDMFEKTFKVKLYRDIASNLPYIKCKGSQIKRVIVNLFINACQAVEHQEIKKISITAWSEDQKVFFAIKDNGPGIPENIMPHIFKEHYTTKKDGNGLGLSMVRDIIKNHNGTIECKSIIGKGTAFTFALPAVDCN